MKKASANFLQIVIIPLVVIFLLWIILARIINSVLILPGPVDVFIRFFQLLKQEKFLLDLLGTIFRSLLSFLVSLIISMLLGFWAAFNNKVDNFLKLPLSIIKATPVVSFILLAIFWFTTNMVPVFVSVLMTLPVMTTAIYSGLKHVDPKLVVMSNAYEFSRKQRFVHLFIPTMMPFFFSGALSAFGISWKAVVAAEVLCLPKYATGTAMQRAKVHLDTADVFAITIAIILISFILESIFSFAIKKWNKKYA